MKIVVTMIAIVIAVTVVGLQANRTKDLYKKKFDENKDEFEKHQQ